MFLQYIDSQNDRSVLHRVDELDRKLTGFFNSVSISNKIHCILTEIPSGARCMAKLHLAAGRRLFHFFSIHSRSAL